MKIGYVTAPPEEANGLARRAVDAGIAACVNVLFGVTSHYRWQDEIHADSEALLIAKVPEGKEAEFTEQVRAWHPYTCPEILLTDVVGGDSEYISWVNSACRPGGDG
jgi:periplasmic divalent cation tolerance protein